MYHICKILKTFPLGSYWWNLEIFLFESQNKKRMAQSWCLLKNFEQCHSGKKANIKKFDTKRLQKMEWSESCSVVSDSLLPHGLWPWTSPGQNTGVDSFSLLQGIFPTQGLNPDLHSRQILGKQKMEWSEVTQSCLTLGDPMDCSLPGSSPWDFPGNSTGVGCHFLLQRIFSTQGCNPGLPHCRQTLDRLCHQGSSH